MKSYFKIFGFIALAAVIGFSIAACGDDDDDGGGTPPSLLGSWYNDDWKDIFTFNADKTFTKMHAEWGTGERGTYTYTASSITTTITAVKDDSTDWDWGNPPSDKELVETRSYILSGDTLVLNGEWVYTRYNVDGGDPSVLEGSWHSAQWSETFTFDAAAGTFEKMNDGGWGERGTFTCTATTFSTTITEIKDDTTDWGWGPATKPADELFETRTYSISGDILLINGEHEYIKQND